MTYTFKVLTAFDGLEVGQIIEIDLKITEYDRFKAAHPELERYFDEPPAFKFAETLHPPGQVMERLDHIRNHYPGAKDMFNGTKWRPSREW